ncbi:MAG: 30S ribosomal protein S20 [Planctomycetota bacterium]
MAHSKQAKKRIRQNERARIRNKAMSSRMRTEFKKLLDVVGSGDRAAAQKQLPITLSGIDKAAKRHIIHRNAAARKKSQAERAVAGCGS